jgi:hypothetical protein
MSIVRIFKANGFLLLYLLLIETHRGHALVIVYDAPTRTVVCRHLVLQKRAPSTFIYFPAFIQLAVILNRSILRGNMVITLIPFGLTFIETLRKVRLVFLRVRHCVLIFLPVLQDQRNVVESRVKVRYSVLLHLDVRVVCVARQIRVLRVSGVHSEHLWLLHWKLHLRLSHVYLALLQTRSYNFWLLIDQCTLGECKLSTFSTLLYFFSIEVFLYVHMLQLL